MISRKLLILTLIILILSSGISMANERVAISIGHYPNDPDQARLYNFTEYGESAPIVGFIIEALTRKGYYIDLIGSKKIKEKAKEINSTAYDAVIEIHLNDSQVIAEGCETLYYPNSKEGKALASSIQELLPKVTDNADRGVKKGWYWENGDIKGTLGLLRESDYPTVIVEPYFLKYEREFRDCVWKKKLIGQTIAQGIINYLQDKS